MTIRCDWRRPGHGVALRASYLRSACSRLAQVAKKLVLVRHAKAATPDGVPDHDRPLTERGRRDALEVGRWLRSLGLSPQVALVSGASRAQETFRLLAAELDEQPEARITEDAYYAGAGELLELVRALPAATASALLVAHNPGIGMLASLLDDGRSSADGVAGLQGGYPTSAVTVFELSGDWAELDPGAARLTAATVARG